MKKKFIISKEVSVKQAMRQMDEIGKKGLFVVDKKNRLLSSVTDGDIRRWILAGQSLEEEIGRVGNKKPITVKENYDFKAVKKIMLDKRIEYVPVLDRRGKIVEILLWDEVLGDKLSRPKGKLNIPVVIMAGGEGKRLDPFTQVLPKPLIPVKGKPIIELIMDKFNAYQINKFYVSVNHRSKMIKAYFGDRDCGYDIFYLDEERPLGTAGGLKFLEDKIQGDFMVTNCDILIEHDYSEILEYHQSQNNAITIVGSYRQYVIPYGVCELENGGRLKEITEKPEYHFLVNTGFCILNSNIFKHIPSNQFFLMTDLIEKIRQAGVKVGVFPISEKSWIDVGQWEEYKKEVEKFNL